MLVGVILVLPYIINSVEIPRASTTPDVIIAISKISEFLITNYTPL